MSDAEINAILQFWFEESKPKDWFVKDEAFDASITQKFLGLHTDIMEKTRGHWRESPEGCLAEIIVLDQFSRNMFRDSPKAFASDPQSLDCLNFILTLEHDKTMSQMERNFAYLPLQHSEVLEDQEKSIELYDKNGDAGTLDYAHQHKNIIEKFGRFPHRNQILGRESTPEEVAFLEQPGSSF